MTTSTPETVERMASPLSAPLIGSAGALKGEVSRIMMVARNGSEPRYRFEGYIRWGMVERDIHAAIDAAMPPNVPAQRAPDKGQ